MKLYYKYSECGLDNVYLVNGVHKRDTPYGEVISIDDIDGLHAAIADDVIEKPSRLSGKEFRFLRQFLAMSQKKLGLLFDVSDQAIAIWEKGEDPPRNHDMAIRNLVREKMGGNAIVTQLLEQLAEAERQEYLLANLEFVKNPDSHKWEKRPEAEAA